VCSSQRRRGCVVICGAGLDEDPSLAAL
jgi:hypothetical protein